MVDGPNGTTNGKRSARLDQLTMLVASMLDNRSSRKDGWSNIITGLGVGNKDASLSTGYTARGPIDRLTLENLYEEDDVFHLVVDRVPEHATRRWIQFTGMKKQTGQVGRADDAFATVRGQNRRTGNGSSKSQSSFPFAAGPEQPTTPAAALPDAEEEQDEDIGRQLLEAHEELGTKEACYELMRLDRLYGGAAILLGVDDGQETEMPLDDKRVRKFTHLHVMHRWELTISERDMDPMSPNFRQPKYYSAAWTGQRVHHSRVLRFRPHRVSSTSSLRGTDGWDLPIIDRVWEPLRQFGSLFGYVEGLFQDLVQGTIKIKGVAEALAANTDEANNAVINRVRTMGMVRSIFNMILLDDEESYERRSATPAGLGDLMLRQMDRLAAASETPLSILFGQAPSGLSTDDKSGRTAFYDSVRNKQTRLLRRIINRITELLILAKKGPFRGKSPGDWSFDFLPLEEPNEKEDADTRLIRAQTDEIYWKTGVLQPSEIRSRLINDARSPYTLDLENDEAMVEMEQQALLAAQEAATEAAMKNAGVAETVTPTLGGGGEVEPGDQETGGGKDGLVSNPA